MGESLVVWGLLAADLLAMAITTRRADSSSETGQTLFHHQVDSFLRHPLAPAAVAIGAVATERLDRGQRLSRLTWLAPAIVWSAAARRGSRRVAITPLAIEMVTGSIALTIAAIGRRGGGGGCARWGRGDGLRISLAIVVAAISLPWVLADVGIYASDLPGLRHLYLGRHPGIAGGRGPAVHLGHHHGLDGALLALTGLLLSRQLPSFRAGPPREVMTLWLALLTVYGIVRAAEDAWYEQIVKRGWTDRRVPPLVVDGRLVLSAAWVWLLLATGGLTAWLRTLRGMSELSMRRD